MKGTTHFVGGLTAGIATASALGLTPGQTIITAAASGLGGLIPDIDHESSTITKKTSIAGWAISRAFEHRGILHTPIAYIVINSILCMLFRNINEELIITGMFIGEVSHLVLDSLNKVGIMWLWPISKKRFNILSVRSGGIADKITQIVCMVVVFMLILK